MPLKRYEIDFSGKKLIVEHGRMAQQAGAAITVQLGETVVMAAATMSKGPRGGDMDFFPLMVDYEERYFAAGRIKGSRFQKREGKPSAEAILIGRMIDRGLRPLFPQDLRNEVQVICLPLSLDGENRPDVVGMLAACLAVHISNIPFDGPVAGVRIGMVNGDYVVNPIVDELEYSELKLAVMGDGERICMVECDALEMPDEHAIKAFKAALTAMGPIAKFFDTIRKEIGVPKAKKEELCWRAGHTPEELEVVEEMKKAVMPHLDKYLFNKPKGSKEERKATLHKLEEHIIKELVPKHKSLERDEDATKAYLQGILDKFFLDFIEKQVTLAILDKDKRVDGRKLDQIRPLHAEVGILPRTHGSGLFARGETQVLSVVTIGAPGDEQMIETMEHDGTQRYFHHYNFLPFSVGEVKPLRGAGRREIGHGALAEKALRPMLPKVEEFPYTVRVVSEVMGSNGSSSMASTCAQTLALMDAGVPIKKPVAGIAMGIATDGDRWKVLTDLQDMEDGPGGMDFKVTATRDGITAIQMDTKTRGLTMPMVQTAIVHARTAVDEILAAIAKVIPAPRTEMSPHAPRIIAFKIDPEKIRDVIGPGGKMIRAITGNLNLEIDVTDDGMVMITSNDVAKAKEAERLIRDICYEPQVGDVFEEAEVVKLMGFGAFVKLTQGQDGFVHVSEIAYEHVDKVDDRLKLGDKVRVKVTRVENGKIDVSMKALLPRPEGYVEPPPRRRPMGGRRGGGREHGRGGDRRGGGRDRGGGRPRDR
jgi:polyribonucleotide nucleotidyltransferase